MASPISIGGVQVLAPDQGDSYAWGQAVKAALAQLAASALQTTGGSFPLTAELNLGPAGGPGLVVPYLKSATAFPASTGFLRLAYTDQIFWRNLANGNDNTLYMGSLVGFPANDLAYRNNGGGSPVDTLITGQPFVQAGISVLQSGISGATIIVWNNEFFDTDNAYNNATGVFTVPANKGGAYLIVANLVVAQSTATGLVECNVFINGVLGPELFCASVAAGSFFGGGGSTLINVSAGQTIDVRLKTSAGTCATTTANGAQIAIKRMV